MSCRKLGVAAFAAAGLCASLLHARVSPGGEEEAKMVRPFNGRDLRGWTFKEPRSRSKWRVGSARMDAAQPAALVVSDATGEKAELVNSAGHGVDIYTREEFGDCTISLEFMVPRGSNSGIYVMGEYEVQILDSYGKEQIGPGDLGGLYGAAAPRLNAALPPGQWQKFAIEFQAPRFRNGVKAANARFKKVTLNGKVIHENVEMKGPTPSGVTGKESPIGPLMFQGDHGPVAYRNIVIKAHPGN